MEKKLCSTSYSPGNYDVSALLQSNQFDDFLNDFLKWVNSELGDNETPIVKTLFISERSWGMLQETVSRAGYNGSPELWKQTIVCPLYLFTTTTPGRHATQEQHEENLRHVLPFAEPEIIETLARFDSLIFVQAPREYESMKIPMASFVFICLSLLEDWHGIPSGVLTPSTKEWLREYVKQTATS